MIYGRINDKNALLPPLIKKILLQLHTTPPELLEKIDFEEGVSLLINEYTTKATKNGEQHRKFIDLHYLIEGEEKIGFGMENEKNIINYKYNEEKDNTSFKTVENEQTLILREKEYVIFWPGEIHRPGLHPANEPVKVKKVVIKIDANVLAGSPATQPVSGQCRPT